jgi:hypothetical protein
MLKPGPFAVTMPDALIDATDDALLAHAPPALELPRIVVLPTQMLVLPLIVPGNGLTRTDIVFWQPVLNA